MKYFGDPKFRKEYEEQIETPVGVPCMHCDEPIEEGDTGTIQTLVHSEIGEVLRPIHYECRLRLAIGSLGHQRKLCSCYGGDKEDPEGLTRRQAAIVATHYFHLHTKD